MAEQRVVLEHEANPPLLRRDPERRVTADLDRSEIGRFETRDQPQQRRLPRPARAEQCGQRALGDLERDAIDGLELAEGLVDVVQGDGHHCLRLSGAVAVMTSSTKIEIVANSAPAV